MLYVFHGLDVLSGSQKSHTLIDSLRTKKPDAAFVRIEADDWGTSLIEGHISGQGLFSNKYIVFLDRVTENVEAKEGLSSFIEDMQKSANIFIVLEGKINAELKKAFEKHAEKIVVCEKKEEENGKKEEFNIFALTSAMGGSDPVKAWKIYREAIEKGTSAENILGVLFWKAKSTANLPMLEKLITIYHEGHRGTIDMEIGIEKLLLRYV